MSTGPPLTGSGVAETGAIPDADAQRPHGTPPAPPTERSALGVRPWSDSRFWLLQVVVLALYLVRLAASVALHLDSTLPAVEFTTVALFLIPVVYAALNFGLNGAAITSGWVSVLAIPRFVEYLENHNASGAWAEMMQVVVLNVVAVLVGQRVSAERSARQLAESAERAHLSAEALYRDLFDSNQAPILIVDGEGRVVEANASALRVFAVNSRRHPADFGGDSSRPRLLDVIGPQAAGQVLGQLVAVRLGSPDGAQASPVGERVQPVALDVDGRRALFRPTATMLQGQGDKREMQVVFEDVTAETERHNRMEAYATQVVLGQEEERRHIAQELHDGPVQTLIHLCRQIDTVDVVAPPGAIGTADLSELRLIVEATVAELRGIAKGLRPSILDDLGLVASVSQLVDDAARRNDFRSSISVTGSERRLSTAVELSLFRISQEALSNIERHAGASTVSVGLDFDDAGVRLLISDDGCGFELLGPTGDPGSASLGLPGMEERAHLIGGTFLLESVVGTGSTVEVWVPDADRSGH